MADSQPTESATVQQEPQAITRHVTYKFRLRTRPRHERLFRQFCGAARYVYNRGLALQISRKKANEPYLSLFAIQRELTTWRNDPQSSWLGEIPLNPQRQALQNLEHAFVNFSDGRTGHPLFKKKGKTADSFGSSDLNRFHIDNENGRVKFPKVGWVRYYNSRKVEGKPRTFTVKRDGRHWFVSIACEQTVPVPVHPHPESAVGIDFGVVNFATLSSGQVVPPLNAQRGAERRLRRQQRKLSRRQKGSNRFKKQAEQVAKLHRRVANRRHDFLHKFSSDVSKNHALVVVEDLQVASMSASARGTVEKPGRNVRQKSGLNRVILDQGWSEGRRQLTYKCEWRGGRLLAVSAAGTSQRCSRCGHVDPANRPSQAVFHCVACGFTCNADYNASCNILGDGQSLTARGGDTSELAASAADTVTPVKREPFGSLYRQAEFPW